MLVGALGLTLAGAMVMPNAGADARIRPEVTVMTRNLYLGSSLDSALAATDPGSFLGAIATIYGTVQLTNFPGRAQTLADEVAAQRPDLVGLQEVSEWITSGPGVPPSQDFLTILLDALAQRGLTYTVAAVSPNADIGPVPLVAPCDVAVVGACQVALKDRDVILVNAANTRLTWSNPRSGNYATQQTFATPFGTTLSFNRGWTSVDAALSGRPFRFLNTHLETEVSAQVQEAQAAEFLGADILGRGRSIVVGDFNSAADGSTTTSYAQLTQVLRDPWIVKTAAPRVTCCQNPTLTNPTSEASSRIDLVLARGWLWATTASIVGTTPNAAAPPLWASDHFGVAATFLLR
jgi:endonuclease/exonuclease/phosphatase family metal-dependent hydrolase